MPGAMVLAIICVVIAVIGGAVAVGAKRVNRSGKDSYVRDNAKMTLNVARIVVGVGLALAVVMTVVSSWTQVPTKEIGVVTTFGHPDGEVGNGLHFINPFSSVTTLDGALQNDQRLSASTCTNVRLGNMSTACVENAVQWRINPSAADELYQNYRDFANIRSNLVDNNLAVELNTAFSTYDPLATLANQVNQGSTNPSAMSTDEQDKLAGQVTAALQKDVGNAITIDKVSITIVHFDASTEDKINQFQAAAANTRIAKQNEQTAAAQAAANQTLSQSLSNDPNVLVSKCLDTLNEMVQKNQPVPAGFNCWGNNTGIVVGTK